MPLYEYVCDQCQRHVEKIQSFSAPPLTECPHCGGHLERALSAPAVQFKGSGWYVSDYGKGGSRKPDSGSSKSGSDISASADSGSEAKPESKPAADSGSTSTTAAPSTTPAKS